MPFFPRESPEERARRLRQQRSIHEGHCRQLRMEAAGPVPQSARNRIEKQRSIGSSFFSSDLTAQEYLLCRETGVQTIGQVIGTAVYGLGYFPSSMGRISNELGALVQANSDACRLAIFRMLNEAKLLGASGVIGVRMPRFWGDDITEFTVIGTAVRVPDYPTDQSPFSCTLNGQEFWKLHKAGCKPLGIALGASAYHSATDAPTQKIVDSKIGVNLAPNQEVDLYSRGFYQAKELATERFAQDAEIMGGDGVVGVDVQYAIEGIECGAEITHHDVLFKFLLLGTVISTNKETLGSLSAPTFSCDLTQ